MSGQIERAIVRDIEVRLKRGAADYGPFTNDDERDMLKEAYEEALDCSVYLARAIQLLDNYQKDLKDARAQIEHQEDVIKSLQQMIARLH